MWNDIDIATTDKIWVEVKMKKMIWICLVFLSRENIYAANAYHFQLVGCINNKVLSKLKHRESKLVGRNSLAI